MRKDENAGFKHFHIFPQYFQKAVSIGSLKLLCGKRLNYRLVHEQEGHNGPVSLHWLLREIPSYQTLQYLGIGLKHKTPNKG